MRVLLDTQAFLIGAGIVVGRELPRAAQRVIDSTATQRVLSTVSLMEIAAKSRKLGITRQECEQALHDLDVTVLSFTREHALALFSLPVHHGDPFDRMLIATALEESMPLVGGDRQFSRYKGLRVIW